MLSYQEINNIIKGKLSYNRYRHTLGVINSAVELSEIHGENRNSARLAALIHDISKDIDNVEQINLANKYKIEIDKISAAQPSLLHGIIGSYIAKNNFGIIDREILNAIKYHTTGRANMSKLEKIIYLADYIEEGRNFSGLDTIRRIVKENLDQAMLLALDNSIQYIIQKQKLIHPLTIEARNDILHKMYYNN